MNDFGLLARLIRYIRLLLPGLASLVLVVVGPAPIALIFGTGAITPSFIIPIAYFWSIYRPDLVPGLVLILFALCEDAIVGRPIGAGAVVTIVVLLIIKTQEQVFRLASQGYHWFGFALVAAAAGAAGWLVMSVYHWTIIPISPVAVQGLLLIALYPVIGLFLAGIMRLAPSYRPL